MISAQLLIDTGRVKQSDAQLYAPLLTVACFRFGINTTERLAQFLSNVLVESGGLAIVKENLNYSKPERLMQVWPSRFTTKEQAAGYVKNPKKLADLVYGGRMGNRPGTDDGSKYLGRGLIQCTGLDNYRRMTNALGRDYVNNPEYLERPEDAALSAACFFSMQGCIGAADRGDSKGVCRLVNGGYTALDERTKLYEHIKGLLCR